MLDGHAVDIGCLMVFTEFGGRISKHLASNGCAGCDDLEPSRNGASSVACVDLST